MHKKNILLAFALLLASSSQSWAQQIPLFTQYRENFAAINPAALPPDFFSDGHHIAFGVSYRRQWNGLPNAPTTQVLHGEWFENEYSGFHPMAGGYLLNDQTGPTGFTGLYAKGGGIFSSDMRYSGIAVALSLGAVQYRINTSELQLHDANDIRAAQDRAQLYPDVGMGVFAYQKLEADGFDGDYLYGGVSIPQVLGLDTRFTDPTNGNFSIRRMQHFFANLGWYHFIGESSFLEFSAYGKYVHGVTPNFDLNVRYQMASSFWLGMGSSTAGNLHSELGIIIGKNMGTDANFKIGYGFDYSFQSFGPYVGATHEINLGYAF